MLFPIPVIGFKVEGPVFFPNGFAGLLIDANHVLGVVSVEMNDQGVLVRDGGGRGPTPMVALKISSFPNLLSRIGFQGRRSMDPKWTNTRPPSITGVGVA